MGKGHKERRREQRARELEEREVQLRELKSEIEKTEEIIPTEKLVETCSYRLLVEKDFRFQEIHFSLASDTDSGHGSSSTIASIDSPKPNHDDSPKPRALIKGLTNNGNTCFFNVIVQVKLKKISSRCQQSFFFLCFSHWCTRRFSLNNFIKSN